MPQTLEYTMPEFLQRLNAGQIPMTAKVQVTLEEAALPRKETGQDLTLLLFEQWNREDDAITPEEQAKNERIYSEIEKNGISRVRI